MNHRSILSALGILALFSCSAGNQSAGAKPQAGGGNGSGAQSGLGSGNPSAGGGSNTDINVNDDAGLPNGE